MTSQINNRFSLASEQYDSQLASIKVIGIGGGGSNAVDHMIDEQIDGVEFYIANTDAQALMASGAPHKIQLGRALTKGLGAGADPKIGRDAAFEDPQDIVNRLGDANMVFVTAGMGGGTGTGAAPVIAQTIKQAVPDILVIAVVTTPFEFEGSKRMMVADSGLQELQAVADNVIIIPNEKILADEDLSIRDAFAKINAVLRDAVKGIADLITMPGYINVDFADVKTVLSEVGGVMMGCGSAAGENAAAGAAGKAIESTMVGNICVADAKGILVNITSSSDMSMGQLKDIGTVVKAVASDHANVIMGHVFDETLQDEIRVTLVATGLQQISTAQTMPDETAELHFDDDCHEQTDDERLPNSESALSNPEIESGNFESAPFETTEYEYSDSQLEEHGDRNELESASLMHDDLNAAPAADYSEARIPVVFRNSNGKFRPQGNGDYRTYE